MVVFGDQGHTYTLYCNDVEIGSYVLSTDKKDVATWEVDSTENSQYLVTKSDESEVTVITTEIITEKGYDLQVKEVKCWWADITINNEASANTQIENVDEADDIDSDITNKLLNGTGIEEASEEILENATNEKNLVSQSNIYRNDSDIFYESEDTETDTGEKGFLNSIYNYIKDNKDPKYMKKNGETNDNLVGTTGYEEVNKTTITDEGININSEVNYDTMDVVKNNRKEKYCVIKQTKSVTYGIPSGDYELSGVLALLKDNKGDPIEYRDIYDRNNSDNSTIAPGEMLVNGAEMTFELLDSSENTEGLSDVMRYLLYLYSGNDYGVTSSIFNDYSLSNIYLGSSELLRKYIFYWENASGPKMNADGTKYIIEDDGVGHPTVGYGLDIFNGGFVTLFKNAGYPTEIGGEVDKEFVDNLTDKEINECYSGIESKTQGLNLTEYQKIAMTSRAYNCGIEGATYVREEKTFKEAYSAYWKQDKDDLYKLKNKNADFNHKLYTTYMSKPVTSDGQYLAGLERRRKSEWTLFQTGYFDVLNAWYEEKGKIVEIADEMAKIMSKEKWTYCVGNCNEYEECSKFRKSSCPSLVATFEKARNGKKTTCCATFVSWVLQEAGYITESEHTNSAGEINNLCSQKRFTKITNSNDLQPGDILYYDYGHVEIYAGDNKVYNAGSGDCIRGNVPRNWRGYMTCAWRAPDA